MGRLPILRWGGVGAGVSAPRPFPAPAHSVPPPPHPPRAAEKHGPGAFAAEVEDGLHGFHLDPCPREFQTAWADAGLQETDHGAQPVGHAAKGHAACGAGGVFQEAFDGGPSFAFVGEGFCDEVWCDEGQQFGASGVADDQPLVAVAAHVADGDVCQPVGVIDAGFSGEGEEIGG